MRKYPKKLIASFLKGGVNEQKLANAQQSILKAFDEYTNCCQTVPVGQYCPKCCKKN